MSTRHTTRDAVGRLVRRGVALAEKQATAFPPVRDRLERQYDEAMQELESVARPYRGEFPAFSHLPEDGRNREEIIQEMEKLAAREAPRWQSGHVSGAVYNGDQEHIDFLNRVYAINSQANPLHADVWPSTARFEAEIVAMTAHMLGAGRAGASGPAGVPAGHPAGGICGTVTSGGTESILLAMKTYRDWAREVKGITRPEIVAPVTAHAAFDKAAQYFGIKLVSIPVDAGFRADTSVAQKAITRNTIALVGSAPTFPHGVIDPILELSELARQRGIGFHTDACLGGFILPWAERLGYDIPLFDFRLPGVTSISVDTHKYGYAAKGTSVILYRERALRHHQYYTTTDWPGGMYFSPTLAGSRPGALSATCWAAMLAMGEDGYIEATRKILETARQMREGIASSPGLYVLGDPLFVIAFGSQKTDIYRVMDCLARRGWSLNGLHRPPALHICVTLRHTQPGLAEQFLDDLRSSVEEASQRPQGSGGMAPIYGMAATLPLRGVIDEMLKRYLDLLYEVDG